MPEYVVRIKTDAVFDSEDLEVIADEIACTIWDMSHENRTAITECDVEASFN